MAVFRWVLRVTWRNRARLAAQGDGMEREAATILRAVMVRNALGRRMLAGYRTGIRAMGRAALLLAVGAAVLAVLLWRVAPELALLAVLPAGVAALLAWWRMVWGAPLAWLDEHADAGQTVTVREIPGRLRALATRTRAATDLPASLASGLERLAGRADRVRRGRGE